LIIVWLNSSLCISSIENEICVSSLSKVKGVLKISSIIRSHQDYIQFKPYEVSNEVNSEEEQEIELIKIGDIVEVFKLPKQLLYLQDNPDHNQIYTLQEATELFWDYINKNDLTCQEYKSCINFNESIVSTFCTQKDKNSDKMEKKEIISKYKEKLRPHYFITLNGIREFRKGTIKEITINENRRGRRWTTEVWNLDQFELDLKQMASSLKKKFSSSSVVKKYKTTGGKMQETVLIQGKVGDQTKDFLIEKINIPSKYIDIASKQ